MLAEILGLATDTVIIIILMIKTTMTKPDLDLSGFPWMPGTCTQDWTDPAMDQSRVAVPPLQRQKENKEFIHHLVAGGDFWAWFHPTWHAGGTLAALI